MSMVTPPDNPSLDERLVRAFAGLDVNPDFDTRLAARMARESEQDLAEHVRRARQLEQERYRTVRHLRGWRQDARSLLRLATLETAGVSALIVIAAVVGWTPFTTWLDAQMGSELVEALHQNSSIIWPSTLGILLGIAPLVAQRLRARQFA
ncbi:MAG TPA: hypothetical protein VGL55_06650 [Steroidobacteraceae bacterium]